MRDQRTKLALKLACLFVFPLELQLVSQSLLRTMELNNFWMKILVFFAPASVRLFVENTSSNCFPWSFKNNIMKYKTVPFGYWSWVCWETVDSFLMLMLYIMHLQKAFHSILSLAAPSNASVQCSSLQRFK